MEASRKRVEQNGNVEHRRDGSYYLRYWTEPNAEGKRHRRAVEIGAKGVGAKGPFHDRKDAELSDEAVALRRQINAGVLGVTMGQVIATFERDALPPRVNTRATTRSNLAHCRAQWDEWTVRELALPTNAKLLEGWLNTLQTRSGPTKPGGRPASKSTKKNVRQQMTTLFDFAMLRGYIPSQVNPIRFVRLREGEASRRRQTMTAADVDAFFDDAEIPEHVKAVAAVAKYTGLRISEILALREQDVDLDALTVTVRRRVYRGDMDAPKSEKSGEPVPIPEELIAALERWRRSPYFFPVADGSLFISYRTRRPFSADGMQILLHGWGEKHGIEKMGWHTFRHSYKQYLEDRDTPLEVVQRLMRHASVRTTMGYGSGVKMERLRAGQRGVVEALRLRPVEVMKKRRWA